MVLLGFLGLVAAYSVYASHYKPPGDVTAYAMCQQFVKQRLTSPGSATFPAGSVGRVTSTGAQRYRVTAYVDSQNGFGALLRSNFVCDIEGPDASDNWHLTTPLTLTER